jgi:uncharacterized membrane protein YdcZ (DUF606 family)
MNTNKKHGILFVFGIVVFILLNIALDNIGEAPLWYWIGGSFMFGGMFIGACTIAEEIEKRRRD